MQSEVSERKRIDAEIKRINVTLRSLRARKKLIDVRLYEFMVRTGQKEHLGVKITSVRPRLRKK